MNKVSLALLVLASAAAGAAMSGYAGMRPIATAEAATTPHAETMVVVDQAPVYDGEKVVVMRDTKRNVTCWLFSSGSSSCMPDQWIEPYAQAEANQ